MPKVRFTKENLEVEIEPGESILDAARKAGAPEGDRCGGVCACSTCHVYVVQGFDELEDLSPIEESEYDILERAFDPKPTSRLGCQVKVLCDIEVEISEESFDAFVDEHPEEAERARALRR